MSSDSNFSKEDLQALEKAIAQGVLEVKYTDKTITYRSLDEMLRIRELRRRCLGLNPVCSRIKVETSKGLC